MWARRASFADFIRLKKNLNTSLSIMRTKYLLMIATALFSTRMVAQIVVGPYTSTSHLTNITGACSPAMNTILGDTDFTGGTFEVPFGSVFEGTWASGIGYPDGAGDEILCVSLHTE